MEVFSFEKLNAYKTSKQLVNEVYNLIRQFPSDEKHCLAPQLQRAVISIPSNIAEGCGRCSYKEKVHFLEIAYGSLLESYCQLDIAANLGYITTDELDKLRPLFFDVSKLLSGLRNSYSSTINANVKH